jgi:hypothetical protein
MFKKLAERFPAATAKGSAMYESISHAVSPSADDQQKPAGDENATANGTADGSAATDAETNANATTEAESNTNANDTTETTDERRASVEEDALDGQERPSVTARTASMKAAIQEKINSETVSAAASIAASSMFSFMKKAQSVAAVAAREGAAKATVLKSKAFDMADMDALQRRLSHALDRTTGEVSIDLLNFSYIDDSIVAMGFPSMNSGANRTFIKDNPIDLVSMYLNEKHGGHYMIWNLSGACVRLWALV